MWQLFIIGNRPTAQIAVPLRIWLNESDSNGNDTVSHYVRRTGQRQLICPPDTLRIRAVEDYPVSQAP